MGACEQCATPIASIDYDPKAPLGVTVDLSD